MKKYILFFVLTLGTVTAKAQTYYNYNQVGFSISGSYGKAEADLNKQDFHPAFGAAFVYNFSPYLPIALELQKGTFSGGSRNPAVDKSGRIFSNNYLSLNIHGDLQAGEIIDYADSWFLDRIKGFYIGTGMGFVFNKMTDIQRTNQILANAAIGDPEGFQGKNSSVNLIVPIRLGYEFKIYGGDESIPLWGIDIGIQHYYAYGEGIDGYNDPVNKYKNNATDQYTYVTIGVKYNFELSFLPRTSYNKPIRRFGY